VANLYNWKATPDQYIGVVSNHTFLQGIKTVKVDFTGEFFSYDADNQTSLWIKYLSSLKEVIIKQLWENSLCVDKQYRWMFPWRLEWEL